MRLFLLSVSLLIACVTTANAGFQRWSATVEKNPFSGGVDVSVLYLVSRDAQIQVRCDSGKQGITIVAIPGYEATADALAFEPSVRFAVDGDILLSDIPARVSSFGSNLAGVVIHLSKEKADRFTDGMLSARRQIAIEDGMSTKPFLLTARGSTAAARKVKQCYQAQKGSGMAPIADEDRGKADRIRELRLQIEQLKKELAELEN